MKEDDRLSNTRILMMTGNRHDKRLDMALQAGADGWLAKPLVVEEFVFTVTDLLAGAA